MDEQTWNGLGGGGAKLPKVNNTLPRTLIVILQWYFGDHRCFSSDDIVSL